MDLRHANRIWGTEEGVVRLIDGNGAENKTTTLAVIPLSFVHSLGLRAGYLKRVAQYLIIGQDLEVHLEGKLVSQADEIHAATYTLSRHKPDPTDKSGKRKLQERDESSTVSGSSRQSTTQDRFRRLITARDAAECVITGECDAFGREVDACHIIPKTRGDDCIREILGDETILIDDVTNGMLMSMQLHGSFDFYEWGIYVEGDRFQVHSFVGKRCKIVGHGREMFRRKGEYWKDMLPDRRLISWHYEQCVKARLKPHSSI